MQQLLNLKPHVFNLLAVKNLLTVNMMKSDHFWSVAASLCSLYLRQFSSLCLCCHVFVFFVSSYWGPDEPNRLVKGNPICVEMRFFDTENSWNDISCTTENFWMCEKEAALWTTPENKQTNQNLENEAGIYKRLIFCWQYKHGVFWFLKWKPSLWSFLFISINQSISHVYLYSTFQETGSVISIAKPSIKEIPQKKSVISVSTKALVFSEM